MRLTNVLYGIALAAGIACGTDNQYPADDDKKTTRKPQDCEDVRRLAVEGGYPDFASLVCREVSEGRYAFSEGPKVAYQNLYCLCSEPVEETGERSDDACGTIITTETEGRRVIIDELKRLGYTIDDAIDEIVLQDPRTGEYSFTTRPDVAFFRRDGPLGYFEFFSSGEEMPFLISSNTPFYRVVQPGTACSIHDFVRNELL